MRAGLVFASLVSLVAAGCGGGGGAPSGDRTGEDTLPVIVSLQTPLGLQGARGIGTDVPIVYHLRDREFDAASVEVQYGVDVDGDGTLADDEFFPATPGDGGDGTDDLRATPGDGTSHFFVWNSSADVATGRYVTLDYVYSNQGRVVLDEFGEPVFQSRPGTVVRLRPVADAGVGAWRYTDPFSLNNNNKPRIEIGAAEIPSEGAADRTVNEQVVVTYEAVDPDQDPVRIAVDWAVVSADFDPSARTTEELESLAWTPATTGGLGDGTFDLAATPAGTSHRYAWDSVVDTGTVNRWILLRFRPVDAKLEVGPWAYAPAPFHLDNYTIFTDPEGALPAALGGVRAVLLREDTEAVLLTGGSATAGGPGTDFAALFFPGRSQTTKGTVAELPGGMQQPRVGHTATRLLDGRVLVAGGEGEAGVVSDRAEIYDPETREFALLGSHLSSARRDHVAVLLASGDVLLAGGTDGAGNFLDDAEIFRAAEGTFESVSPALRMGEGRAGAGAVLLPDRRVLVAGGHGAGGALATVEIYDPAVGGFVVTDAGNDLGVAREGLTLTPTLDADWPAVAAGGAGDPPLASLERFDGARDSFEASAAAMRSGRAGHVAVLLGDGRILLAGGETTSGGVLAADADLYDPSADGMDVPNGDLLVAVRDAAVAVLKRGRPVIFGGFVSAAATDRVQVFTPDGGFNDRPTAQIADLIGLVEPWSFGARIPWRAIDPEGDPVRIVGQFFVKSSDTDDSSALPDAKKDRWLAATMLPKTVVGDRSSGLSSLSSRTDVPEPGTDPIDAPDSDAGEHLFVWDTATDLPRGDYDNVFFRILVYGAEEGTGATSSRFSITRDSPAIARISKPLNSSGNVVFPYYVQDSDSGSLARVVWEYAVDGNGDGRILEADGETWISATHSPVTVAIGGTDYSDDGSADLVSGSKDPDPNNDYTSPDGIPYGKLHTFVWDSVRDVGAPAADRSDLVLRVRPFGYEPGHAADEAEGIEGLVSGFTLKRDPNGLYLDRWYPAVASADPSGTWGYTGVKLDEPIVFEFTAPVDPASLAGPAGPQAIRIFENGGGSLVSGYFAVDNSSGRGTVTFYPQVQEVPARTDVLVASTGYSVEVPGYDPAAPTRPVVTRLGADPDDTNARVLLLGSSADRAFVTGTGVLPDAMAPSYSARISPASDTDAPPSGDIEIEIDDRLDAGRFDPTEVLVYARVVPGLDSLVPGTWRLENLVDENGPGGTLRRYSRLVFTPALAMPPDGTPIEVRIGTGLVDLGGNRLSSAVTTTFSTAAGTQTVTDSILESFDDTDHRDPDLTTAFWGSAAPAVEGNPAGSGVAGKLTGLYDGGDGSDGALDLSSGDVTLTSTSKKSEWQFTKIVIPYGRTLTLKGTDPITLRVQGDVEVYGTIRAAGEDGQSAFKYASSGTSSGAKGGVGGPGGGAGGSAGSYTYQQQKAVDGGDGTAGVGDTYGVGAGKGGTGVVYGVSGQSYSYWGAGGGGGGHATIGEDGGAGYYATAGAGGDRYGSSRFTNLEAGGGGGSGGSSVVYYTSQTWYGAGSGAGGGGGGGGLLVAANGTLMLPSSGAIMAGGGDGGDVPYLDVTITIYPGGGGGGGGGTLAFQLGGFNIDGKIDVEGGLGGRTYATQYANGGGRGGDGRIRLEAPGYRRAKLFQGKVYAEKALISTGSGGTTDWKIITDTTIDTDTGLGIPGYLTVSGGVVLCRDLDVSARVTIKGSKPLIIEASGDVSVDGEIVVLPPDAGLGNEDRYGSSSGWRFGLSKGAPGVAGGFDGGGNGGTTSSTYSKSIAKPEDGVGVDGKKGGDGAGKAGATDTKTYSWTSSSNTYYHYYYSGSGGGGGSAEAGATGSSRSYSGTYAGTPGDGGKAVTDGTKLDKKNFYGGAGGGGGANGGYYRVPSSGSTYYYSYGPGAGGGGGGGGLLVAASGRVTLSGLISTRGGEGGDTASNGYQYYGGPGGGGGGGNVLLQAEQGFDFGIVRIDARGGAGGRGETGTTLYNSGGDGGDGAIVFRSKKDIDLPGMDIPKTALFGDGSFTGGEFQPSREGVSTWYDSGAVAPTFVSRTMIGNGSARLSIQGAQTDVYTGDPDEDNVSAWVDATSGDLSGLAGYRYFRFKVELQPVIGTIPEVSSVAIDWKYRK